MGISYLIEHTRSQQVTGNQSLNRYERDAGPEEGGYATEPERSS